MPISSSKRFTFLQETRGPAFHGDPRIFFFFLYFQFELLHALAEKSTKKIIQLFGKLLRGTQIHNSQQAAQGLIIKMYHYKILYVYMLRQNWKDNKYVPKRVLYHKSPPLHVHPLPPSLPEWLPGGQLHFSALEIKLEALVSFLSLEEIHGKDSTALWLIFGLPAHS